MAKKYKVLLKEVDYYYSDIEAESAQEAEQLLQAMLDSGEAVNNDFYNASDYQGFEVVHGEAEEITE